MDVRLRLLLSGAFFAFAIASFGYDACMNTGRK